MNDHDCHACREYNELSRRGFLKAGGLAMLAAGVPAWLPRFVFAQSHATNRDVIVYVFLRGGADGLTMVVPYGDTAYAGLRPNIKLLPPGGGPTAVTQLQNDSFFGLAPALGSLTEPYNAGKLAIVHASGYKVSSPSRSHFDAQRFFEVGKFNDPTIFTGWLGRHLADTGAVMPTAPVRAIGVANGLQQSLVSSPKSIPVPGLSSSNPSYNITGSGSTAAARLARLNTMYNATADPVKTAAQTTQATITLLNGIGFGTYVPQGGAVYPTSSFGYAMRSTAAMVKANIGLEAVAIDKGGWDLHANLGSGPGGAMNGLMDDLAKGLLAFYRDVVVSSSQRVVVVVMSEFGRRAAENGSLGVDHGFGNVMFLLGHRVAGGQVFSRNAAGVAGWPGLGAGQLFQNLDLAVTIDFRTVLSEVCQNLLDNTNLGNVFPGFVQQPYIGVTAP